ncbi:M55 family metallopeptidase [Herbiconiux sp.]|uniref:M55 family metallopeptidase n=1 Tax=Herbiconiux sp. TaxID=1871186 RepID=UPI0025C4738D|nr:M55 family metallopeptidase [Herbiconiux sp.]
MDATRRFFISADLEGVAGVVASEELRPGKAEYDWARRLLADEVNAAVRGIRRADAAAEVVVSDGHGGYRNILPADLDPTATLLRGKPRPLAMVDGIRSGDEALFIGYHPRAGVRGTLSHTFDDAVVDLRCNGRPLGEAGLNAAVLTEVGATLLLVSGSDALAAEVAELSADVGTVVVSTAVSSSAAESVHPSVACERIEDAVHALVTARGGGHVRIEGPVTVDVDLAFAVQADAASVPPPVTRTGERSVRVVAPTMAEAYRWIRTIVALAAHR